MKNLKSLGVSIALICVFAISAFAGETNSPPCALEPGSTNSPPCSAAQSVGDAESDTQNQAVSTASGATTDYSIGDATVDVLLTALSLF